MMETIKLKFPFKLGKNEIEFKHESHTERKNNVISFALDYKFNLMIERAVCKDVSKHGNKYIFVFEFEDINDAINWMNDKSVDVLLINDYLNVYKIEKEMNDFMVAYERGEKSARNEDSKYVEDEYGFMKKV